DAIVFTALNIASAAASAAIVGAPQVKGDAVATQKTGTRHNVITGRKQFITSTTEFTAGLRFRVFIDGTEQVIKPPTTGGTAQKPTVARGLSVKFPTEYTHPD